MERFQELERGAVYFFGLRRLLIVLHPEEREVRRVLVIGKRRLPDAKSKARRAWGFVESAAADPRRLERELLGLPPTGQGVYLFARHEGHVHWLFENTNGRRGAYIVLGKDPAAREAPRADPRQPELDLGLPLRTRTWAALSSPLALDAPGAQFVLVATRVDPGIEVLLTPRPPPPLWKGDGPHGILPA